MDAKLLRLLALLLCLAGCASTSEPARRGHGGADGVIVAWPLAELAAAEQPYVVLMTGAQPVGMVATRHLRAAWQAGVRIQAAAGGIATELVVATDDQPNAFAFYHDGRPKVAVSLGMIRLLGDDEAAWAALLGHEQTHLDRQHQEARRRRQTNGSNEWLGIVLSLVGVPLGGALADAGNALVERGYSRDEEREADRVGAETMIRAGYDPAGAIRLQERLAAAGGSQALPFLSTHPSGSERIETMRRLIEETVQTGK